MGDDGRIRLHRDTSFGRIEFEQDPPKANGYVHRGYWLHDLDGKRRRMVSVTTFLGILEKRALLRWYEQQGVENALAAERSGLLKDIAISDACEVLRANKLSAEEQARIAAQRGLNIHAILEAYTRDGVVPNPIDHPAEHRPYIRHLIRWLLSAERRGLEVEAVERLVCHPGFSYAGRMDLRAKLSGFSYVIDLKTNRHGRVWDDQHLQPVAYAVADEVCGSEPVHDCLIVAVGPEGYDEMRACSGPADFKAILEVYRRMAKLRAAVKAERDRLAAVAA